MNTCPTEPRLTACLLGDLPKAEADAVHTHIETCPACRAAASELAPLLGTLRAALASDAATPLTLDPVRMAAILATPPPHRARRRRPRFWLAPVIGLAATGIIVLSASLFFPGFESNPYHIRKGSGDASVACDIVLVPMEAEAADGDGDGLRDIVVRKAKKRPGNMNERAELGATDTETLAEVGATDTETLPVDIRKGWSEDRDKRGRDGHSRDVEPTTTPEPVGVHKPEPIASDDINGGVFYDNAPPDKAPARASPEMRAKLQIAIADIAKAREDYPRAKAQYERVVTDPISGRTAVAKQAELKIAEVDRLTRNYDAATERLEKLETDGNASVKSEARFQQAQIKFDQEDYAGAREALARVKEIAPDHKEAALLEGKLTVRTGKLMEATEIRLGSASPAADPKPSVDGTPVSRVAAVEQVKSPVLHEPAAHRTAIAKRPIISKYSSKPVELPVLDDSKVSDEVEKDSRSAGQIVQQPVSRGSAVEQVKSPVILRGILAARQHGKGPGSENEPASSPPLEGKVPPAPKKVENASLEVGGVVRDWKESGASTPEVPIMFGMTSVNESSVAFEEDEAAQPTYSASASRVHSKGGVMGAGGGRTGGWPDGMGEGLVRFIRMKYDGSGWDDGMDEASRADLNFLDNFRNLTGFKTSTKTESHGIALLSRYPKGFAPPFVFMTGDKEIRVSDKEKKILRDYLLGGGMLFADCGSPEWNTSFREFINQVMPGEPLLNISHDDLLFQQPFSFQNGAPPLWHHGGNRALGVKHKGRWAVFYHPGNLHSAWKQDRGGLSAQKAEGALEMGVNIVYYAFSNYLELTRKLRNGEKPDAPVIPDPPTPVPVPPMPVLPAPVAPTKASSTPVKPRVPAVFNPFVAAAEQPLSTFAIDVDTASYTRTRQAILAGQLPEPEAVRTEEVVNAFDYGDRAPDLATFRIFVEGSPSPFGHGTSLIRLGIKGRRLGREESRPAVLTFVVDASGSMAQPDRFGLARLALDELIGRLGPNDRIQLIAFNDTARVLADPVAATGRKEILAAFDRIQCTGSTHLESGLRLAYDRAAAAFRPGAENRVILISDGVANLGSGAAADILTHIDAARRQGITLAVFGVGRGTYNDEMLEQLANRGDGTYRFLDSADEVRRAFVDDLAATLYNIASDVKIQVEWLPAAVTRYRQLGYENRALT
ncbi:MAG: von Willebrand factor type A domain-containing protein, partial [Lentisphaerota bacterium]